MVSRLLVCKLLCGLCTIEMCVLSGAVRLKGGGVCVLPCDVCVVSWSRKVLNISNRHLIHLFDTIIPFRLFDRIQTKLY